MMYTPIKRFFQIIIIFIRYGLDRELLPGYLSPSTLLRVMPSYRRRFKYPLGERYFLAFCDLGPLFVKLGQLISIRHDLFPEDIIKPLAKTQNNVPPFDDHVAFQCIERELKKPLGELFWAIEKSPIAQGSIAQVYGAQLKCGQPVAIKVLRPNVESILKTDMKLAKALIQIFGVFKPNASKVICHLIDEYNHTLSQEINLLNEACHYSQIAHNFKDDHRLYVPAIYWSHTTKKILTSERIYAPNMNQINSIPNVDKKKLAYFGINIFFTQVFKHRFFHADMHPGNVLVDVHAPKYIPIDFGICGVLSETDQYYLCENFLAFYQRDYTKIAKLHIESGWVASDTDLCHFESALRYVCEPIFAKPLAELSIAELMHRLVEACKPFNLKIQPQLLMLQKTLFHVESLSRTLYPELNLWEASKPFIKSYFKERVSLKASKAALKAELPRLLTELPTLPHLLTQRLKTQPPPPQSLIKPFCIGLLSGMGFCFCLTFLTK